MNPAVEQQRDTVAKFLMDRTYETLGALIQQRVFGEQSLEDQQCQTGC